MTYADEPDAFPFRDNEVLKGIAENSCRGRMIYLTATPDNELRRKVIEGKLTYLTLDKRPHGHGLCVPQTVYGSDFYLLVRGILFIRKQLKMGRKVILFVPSRRTGKLFYGVLGRVIRCGYLDSQTEDKETVINGFRNERFRLMIATSVLERGVTFSNVEVVVWKADNVVFDEASLIQMSGRVGRNVMYPSGDCLFLCHRRMEKIDSCIRETERANGTVLS